MHVDDLSRLPADPSLFQSMHTNTMFKLSVRTAVAVFQSMHTNTMFKLSVENSGDCVSVYAHQYHV